MGLRNWSREYASCRGWGPEEARQPCTSPSLPHAGGGRCTRCYALHRRHLGQDRDIFVSINDMDERGAPEAPSPQGELGTMVGMSEARIDPAAERSLRRLHRETLPPDDTGPPDFAVFTVVGAVVETGPALTLRKDGSLTINAAAYALLGHPAQVELLYARDRRTLGVRACAATVAHARPIRRDKGGRRQFVSVRPLLKFYDLAEARTLARSTRRYDDILAVQLAPAARGRG